MCFVICKIHTISPPPALAATLKTLASTTLLLSLLCINARSYVVFALI